MPEVVLGHDLRNCNGKPMTKITIQDGKVVMRDGKVGTEQACCCEQQCPCELPLPENVTVTATLVISLPAVEPQFGALDPCAEGQYTIGPFNIDQFVDIDELSGCASIDLGDGVVLTAVVTLSCDKYGVEGFGAFTVVRTAPCDAPNNFTCSLAGLFGAVGDPSNVPRLLNSQQSGGGCVPATTEFSWENFGVQVTVTVESVIT